MSRRSDATWRASRLTTLRAACISYSPDTEAGHEECFRETLQGGRANGQGKGKVVQ